MSHIIPPLVSNSPPPIVNVSDDETFGDFDAPYEYDGKLASRDRFDAYEWGSFVLDLSRPDFGDDPMLDVPKSDTGKINGYDEINGRLEDVSIADDGCGLESDMSNLKISFDSCVVANGICSDRSNLDVSVGICVSDSSTNLENKLTDRNSSVGSEEVGNCVNGSRLDLTENQRSDSPFGEFVDSSETSLDDRSADSKLEQNLDSMSYSESRVEVKSSASDLETDSKAHKTACDDTKLDSAKIGSNFVQPESREKELIPENETEFGTFVDSSETQHQSIDVSEESEFGNFVDGCEMQPDGGDSSTLCQETRDDSSDFGDFAEPEADAFSDFRSCSRERKPASEENFDEIVQRMFPKSGNDGEKREADADCCDNVVMDQLKDITDTSALAYQWSKSHSHGAFLKALNIDMRNIVSSIRISSISP